MARMMHARGRVKVRPWYYTDYSGDYHARERREARAEIDSCEEDIEDGRRIRECWQFHYSLYPDRPDFVDRVLDLYGIPRPPSRERRTP